MRLNLLISLSDRLCESIREINRKIRGYKAHKWLWLLMSKYDTTTKSNTCILDNCCYRVAVLHHPLSNRRWQHLTEGDPNNIACFSYVTLMLFLNQTTEEDTIALLVQRAWALRVQSYKNSIMHIITSKSTPLMLVRYCNCSCRKGSRVQLNNGSWNQIVLFMCVTYITAI